MYGTCLNLPQQDEMRQEIRVKIIRDLSPLTEKRKRTLFTYTRHGGVTKPLYISVAEGMQTELSQ